MKKVTAAFFLLGIILLFATCRKPEPFPEELMDERKSGGSQTAFDNTTQAFSNMFVGMNGRDEHVHELGDAAFEQIFVTAPAPVNTALSCICVPYPGTETAPPCTSIPGKLMRINKLDSEDPAVGTPIPSL